MNKRAVFVLLLLSFVSVANAQTCCSGGVPLSNNIGGLPPASRGTWQLSAAYDLNVLKTLKDGTETLDDDSRNRTTQTLLLKSGYGISDNIRLELLFTAVRQQRTITQGNFNEYTETNGLGDGVFIIHYQYLNANSWQLAFGIGPKMPIGPSNLKNENGITLNADLQPGSGAWDGIVHHSLRKSLNARPSMVFTNLITYRLTGVNDEYLGSQEYEFGNELSVVLGTSDQFVFLKKLFGYGLSTRYRNADQDRINNQNIANTGGEWIFIVPSGSWQISNATSIIFSGEIPIYSNITGTQLTPTYRLNLGIYVTIGPKRNQLFNLKQ